MPNVRDIREEAMASLYADACNELIKVIRYDPFKQEFWKDLAEKDPASGILFKEEFDFVLQPCAPHTTDEIVRRFGLDGIMARHELLNGSDARFYAIPPSSAFVSLSNQTINNLTQTSESSSEGISKRKTVAKTDVV